MKYLFTCTALIVDFTEHSTNVGSISINGYCKSQAFRQHLGKSQSNLTFRNFDSSAAHSLL